MATETIVINWLPVMARFHACSPLFPSFQRHRHRHTQSVRMVIDLHVRPCLDGKHPIEEPRAKALARRAVPEPNALADFNGVASSCGRSLGATYPQLGSAWEASAFRFAPHAMSAAGELQDLKSG